MRIMRSLALAAFVAAALGLALDPADLAAAPKTKQQLKQEQRKKRQQLKQAQRAALNGPATSTVQPPSTRPAGPVKPAAEVAQLIDSHINRKLAEAKLAAAPQCTDDEFLRRASLDLTGVIPTAEKAKQFLDSADPNKRARLIDELLASPAYGKHQADLWIPKLFPRESTNRFVLREPLVKWLEEQFNTNTPWNKFVFDLLTAKGTVEENPAVTYYLANRSVDKLTDTLSQQFLGVQLQCAQCHNHPFTGWKQTEYWGMAAFFSHVQPQNPRNPKNGADNKQIGVRETVARTRLKNFFPESAKTVPAKFLGGAEPHVRPNEALRPVLAKWLVAADNPYFARAMVNRTWAQLFGRGFVNPIDDMHEENVPSHPELLDKLSRQFVANGYDLKGLVRAICLSEAYQRSSKPVPGSGPDAERDQALFARMTVKVMSPEQLFDSLNQVTGLAALQARRAGKNGNKRQQVTPRDRFVQFYLAGAEQASATEYDAGIPQALKLMNSRLVGNPAIARRLVGFGSPPRQAFQTIYLTALSRRPTPAELVNLAEYLRNTGSASETYSDVLWAVLNSSEFSMVR
jgi:hypothetical protein